MSKTSKFFEISEIELGEANVVHSYWRDHSSNVIGPSWSRDFHLEDFSSTIISSLSIVDVINDGEAYLYRFWGTKNTTIKGFDMTGKYLDEGDQDFIQEFGRDQFGKILDLRRPLAFLYQVEYPQRHISPQMAFRFPLSEDGKTVTNIVTYQDLENNGMEWRAMFESFWKGNIPAPSGSNL